MTTSVLTRDVEAALADIAKAAAVCTACDLHKGRTCSVFSDGMPHTPIVLIGEGPGQHEDETGIPFVGKAGQLLTQILASVGIDRKQDIYICNVVKCRPPQNRAPLPEEMATCFPFLFGQLQLIQPKLILLAGATAVKAILPEQKLGITKLRGQWFPAPASLNLPNAEIMPIFHPSYLLRNQSRNQGSPKWWMWQDIQEVRRKLDEILKDQAP